MEGRRPKNSEISPRFEIFGEIFEILEKILKILKIFEIFEFFSKFFKKNEFFPKSYEKVSFYKFRKVSKKFDLDPGSTFRTPLG